jgi:uncharacterized protein YaaN involved in tellurite resistance
MEIVGELYSYSGSSHDNDNNPSNSEQNHGNNTSSSNTTSPDNSHMNGKNPMEQDFGFNDNSNTSDQTNQNQNASQSSKETPKDNKQVPLEKVRVVPVKVVPTRIVTEAEIRAVGGNSAKTINDIADKILSVQSAKDSDAMGDQLNKLIFEAKKLSPKKQTALAKMFAFTGIPALIYEKKETLFGRFNDISTRVDTLVQEIDANKNLQQERVSDIQHLAEANNAYYLALEQEIEKLQEMQGYIEEELAACPEPTNAFEASNLRAIQNKLIVVKKEINDKEGLKLLAMQTLPNLADQKNYAESLVSTFNEIKEKMIPAYKLIFSQYVITMDQKKGATLALKSKEIFNEAIKKNSDQMGKNAEAITKARLSTIVDAKTLEYNQQKLIERIEVVKKTEEACLKAMQETKPKLQMLERELVKQYQKSDGDHLLTHQSSNTNVVDAQ